MTQENPNSVLPFKVNVKTAVDDQGLVQNISANLALMDKAVSRAALPHDRLAVIVSAGPSLSCHLETVRKLKAEGHTIVCVKHSLPVLVNAGIIPDYCVMLEPRPVDGVSTHGIVRTDLFKDTPKETKYLVSSMSNPTMTSLLIERGLDVTMWHTQIGGMDKFPEIIKNFPVVQGGTSSATRALFLFHTLGFRRFHIVAFDSSCEDVSAEEFAKGVTGEGQRKYMQVNLRVPMSLMNKENLAKFTQGLQAFSQENQVNCATTFTKPFITTGELAAQLQDLEQIYKIMVPHCHITWYEGGAGKFVWDLLVEQNGMGKIVAETVDGRDDFFEACR